MKKIYLLSLFAISLSLFAQDSLRIATWNLEHFGSEGRGFPEHIGLPMRNSEDLEYIAALIKDTLEIDILCVQEIAIHARMDDKSINYKMDTLIDYLGNNWQYFLTYTPDPELEVDMQNAFIYNASKVVLKHAFDLPVPDYKVGDKDLFDRLPLVGHFVVLNSTVENQDLIIVNLHLASGQDNDENHLAATVMVEQNLKDALKARNILEPNRTNRYAIEERIVLGDFNDNPFSLKGNGECCKYMDLLYEYMEERNYIHLVNEDFISTRMSENFNSIIDHVFIHNTLNSRINEAEIYMPCNSEDEDCLLQWRRTYSDHFPVYFDVGF